MSAWDAVPFVLLLVKLLLVGVSVIFFISGIDDCFIDLVFAARALYRRIVVAPRIRPLTRDDLLACREQPIAVMIPAWHEADVIRRMLLNALSTIAYLNYEIFVGVYPNDPESRREVDAVAREHPQVHTVVCSRNGPTCKADCLNHVYRAIGEYERATGHRFEIFVMQDAEDWPHAFSLKLFNHLIPRKDMVQLPVCPLPTRWFDFTSGHYIDEFAESHFKNMVVREAVGGAIPSAGVGSGFSRRALEAVAAAHDGNAFNTASLTEDYEMGFRLHRLGMRQVFVRAAIAEPAISRRFGSSRPRLVVHANPIVVRAYFPSAYSAAVRQKARWVLGITLQGYRNIGWTGHPWTDYMLFRDRKSLVTSVANVVGYVSLGTLLAVWAAGQWFDGYRYPPLIVPGTWIYRLIVADTLFLGLRMGQRAFCTFQFHGLEQALLAVPRQVWANFINFGAAARALRLYIASLVSGRAVAWGKTAHTFPSACELQAGRRRLGELLLERRAVSLDQLEIALRRQHRERRPLGEILLHMDAVRREDVDAALDSQHRPPLRQTLAEAR